MVRRDFRRCIIIGRERHPFVSNLAYSFACADATVCLGENKSLRNISQPTQMRLCGLLATTSLRRSLFL